MTLTTVGIMSPGDMGHTVGKMLDSHGLRVITCPEGRSERTRGLAKKANIRDVPTYQDMVNESDLLLSILVPARAKQMAESIAKAISDTKADIIYVDCNAIAPQTVRQIDEIITGAGGKFVDAGIIGPPPKREGTTRFYASGPRADAFEELNQFGLEVIVLGKEIGQASAMKMCYAALTKGLTALSIALLTAAETLGVSESLREEFRGSQPMLYERMEKQLPGVPSKSRRWVGEMEEIAKTFDHVGLTPKIHEGAADVYRLVGGTELADRTPEATEPLPTLTQMISMLRSNIPKK